MRAVILSARFSIDGCRPRAARSTVDDISERLIKDLADELSRKHSGYLTEVSRLDYSLQFGEANQAVQCALDLSDIASKLNAIYRDRAVIRLRLGVSSGDIDARGDKTFAKLVEAARRARDKARPTSKAWPLLP